MTANTLSDGDVIKLNIQNIKDEITHFLLHQAVVERKIEDCKKLFVSNIVMPKVTGNLSQIKKEDLSVDLIAIKNLSKEALAARYEWYHLNLELADLKIATEVKTNLLHEYQEHLRQYYTKQGTRITDEMIHDKLDKANSLTDLNPEEQKTLSGINAELLKRLNGGQDSRIELYEALQNLILQHG
jgi:hypothetical protein